MAKELTIEECMEIFKKYDPELYDYYQKKTHGILCVIQETMHGI